MAKILNLKNEIKTFTHPNHADGNNPIKYYEDENGCHICVSHAKDKDGYPRIFRKGHRRMSRYIWEIVNGRKIEQGKIILHSCDNPQCINPLHLSENTHKANMADMVKKGRSLKGSKHPNAKLTESDVYFIKFESDDVSTNDLAEMFNITRDSVNEIRRGKKSWQHITKDMDHLSRSNVA